MTFKMNAKNLLLLVYCLVCMVENSESARILGMFPIHSKSHFSMFEAVMKDLADAGHRVDVVSHFPQKKSYRNYEDIINLAGAIPMLNNNVTYELMLSFRDTSLKGVVDMLGNDVCRLMELPELQKLIKIPPTDPPYDIILAEFFFASCYFAFGRHLGIPVVAFGTGTAMLHTNAPFGNPANTALVPEVGDRTADTMTFWQRLKNTFLVLTMTAQIRYFMREQNDMVKKYFGPEMPDIEQLERELSLFLVNSHHVFHGIRPMTPAVIEVGGLHVRDDDTPIPKELKKWLDESTSGFIYFTLGSMVKVESFPKETLAEIYSAFAKVAPIRIVMKVANPEELPPGLSKNVMTLNWAPQVQILKHKNIRGFLTHGGLMGLYEALTFAVPLIGIPLFGDQPGNIQICVEREIAIALDYSNMKADEIIAAINAVAHDPKYKKNMMAISKLFMDRPTSARDTAVFWIEYILRHGEDALRSPAVKLTWWQLALLDVYATMIAAVLIVLYLLKLILSAIFNIILQKNRSTLASKKIKLK